jgi:hypothetical protein
VSNSNVATSHTNSKNGNQDAGGEEDGLHDRTHEQSWHTHAKRGRERGMKKKVEEQSTTETQDKRKA